MVTSHWDAVAWVVASEVHVVGVQATLTHVCARVLCFPIPLVESKPIVLTVHGIPIVLSVWSTKVIFVEDPQVHHDFRGSIWSFQAATLSDHPTVDIPSHAG